MGRRLRARVRVKKNRWGLQWGHGRHEYHLARCFSGYGVYEMEACKTRVEQGYNSIEFSCLRLMAACRLRIGRSVNEE